MGNAISRIGLFFDFIGCFILLIDGIRNSSRYDEYDVDRDLPGFWQKRCLKNLPIKGFAFLALGFALQFIASWVER